MSMVCGLDLHRQQITFDTVGDGVRRGVGGAGCGGVSRERFSTLVVSRRRPSSRRAAGGDGGGGLHRLAVRGRGDRRRRVRGALGGAGRHPGGAGPASGTPRPIVPTPGCSSRVVCSPASCPSRGSRPPMCWSGASGCGSTSRWSINGGCGSNGSTPNCSSTASPCPRGRSARPPPATGCSATRST